MASQTLGASPLRIIFKHLLPNTMGIAVVGMASSIPSIIFAEAFLSFIGLGIQPPLPEWGAMLSQAREYFRGYMYMMVFPGLAIMLSSLSINLIGDGLRDALDPRLRD